MKGISAVALFCEDVRREPGGKQTIIGSMPAVHEVQDFPFTFRRLRVYFRIRLDVKKKWDEQLLVELKIEHGEVNSPERGPAPREMVERTLNKARERELPFATIHGQIHLEEPIEVIGPITMFAILNYGKRREVCGILKVLKKSAAASSDA